MIGVRMAAFAMILLGAALIPAPVRAGEALDQSAAEPERATPNPACPEPPNPNEALPARADSMRSRKTSTRAR